MARCHHCGSTYFFGGVREGQHRYCSDDCRGRNAFQVRCDRIPESTVRRQVQTEQQGPCRKCGGPGPLDIHISYWVWSAEVVMRWGQESELSCRPCATKRQLVSAGSCLLLGWWCIPRGLLITPLQVYRNLRAMLRGKDMSETSPDLERLVRARLAREQAAAD